MTKKEELVSRGWTPLEADELIAIDEGKLKPEDAELVNHVSSDRAVMLKRVSFDRNNWTDRQKENMDYLYSAAVEEWKNNRKKLFGK